MCLHISYFSLILVLKYNYQTQLILFLSFKIVRPKMVETTALGAALAAGFAIGIWSMHSVKSNCDTFIQTLSEEGKLNN